MITEGICQQVFNFCFLTNVKKPEIKNKAPYAVAHLPGHMRPPFPGLLDYTTHSENLSRTQKKLLKN